MSANRECIRCLLRDMAEADINNLQKYIDVIKLEDRVPDELYNERLNICRECELLNAGTCNACGCYVEVRALLKQGRCPKKRWM